MEESQFKPGDRVVYTRGMVPTGGTVVEVHSYPNPTGTWPGFNHYLLVILDTAEEVTDAQSSFWIEAEYDPRIPF
mgnify:FL=1